MRAGSCCRRLPGGERPRRLTRCVLTARPCYTMGCGRRWGLRAPGPRSVDGPGWVELGPELRQSRLRGGGLRAGEAVPTVTPRSLQHERRLETAPRGGLFIPGDTAAALGKSLLPGGSLVLRKRLGHGRAPARPWGLPQPRSSSIPRPCRVPRDRLRWCDRRERRGSDVATCPHSLQWPLCATFNCFCAVGGEPGCPGFVAPARASSSSLLLALTALGLTEPQAPDGRVPRGPRGRRRGEGTALGLGYQSAGGQDASEWFQVQGGVPSPFCPLCPHAISPCPTAGGS